MRSSRLIAAAATVAIPLLLSRAGLAATEPDHRTSGEPAHTVNAQVAAEYPSLEALYREWHSHPELSLMEERTAARLAAELRGAGCEVTEKVGGHGVVAVLRNGMGPTVLIRSDMDALPVAEETGLTYASTVRVKGAGGEEIPVMHACGHDVHMTILVGTARQLSRLKDRWSGTVVLIGQPAEERGMGARAMLADGLYRRFPRPDFAIALHDFATLAVGTVAIADGYLRANVDTVEIAVRGVGGHGAYPHTTKDPIVLAARIVVALQTIVSRETRPTDPAVVTVGSIHGGTKPNIIPNEVKLQLTLRSYSADVQRHTIAAIERICRGEAIAAGMPEDRMPVVNVVRDEATPAAYNDPALTSRVRGALVAWLGEGNVQPAMPSMAADDFGEYGLTTEKVPICMFDLGAVDPARLAESQRTGVPLPSLHSSRFAPAPEPTIKTGIVAMTGAALDLLSPARR